MSEPDFALGDPVLVIGQGLIGLIATQLVRLSGANPIIGIDVDASRLALSRKLGADLTFDARDEAALEAALPDLPGGGPAVTLELSAVPKMIERAIAVTRRKGRIVRGSLAIRGYSTDVYGRAWREGIKIIGTLFQCTTVAAGCDRCDFAFGLAAAPL